MVLPRFTLANLFGATTAVAVIATYVRIFQVGDGLTVTIGVFALLGYVLVSLYLFITRIRTGKSAAGSAWKQFFRGFNLVARPTIFVVCSIPLIIALPWVLASVFFTTPFWIVLFLHRISFYLSVPPAERTTEMMKQFRRTMWIFGAVMLLGAASAVWLWFGYPRL